MILFSFPFYCLHFKKCDRNIDTFIRREILYSQTLFLLLYAACFGEKQQIPIVSRPPISRTRGKRAYHYTIRLLTKNLVETELPGESGGNSGSLISRDDIINVLCYY
jgi:hypothetical protein